MMEMEKNPAGFGFRVFLPLEAKPGFGSSGKAYRSDLKRTNSIDREIIGVCHICEI